MEVKALLSKASAEGLRLLNFSKSEQQKLDKYTKQVP